VQQNDPDRMSRAQGPATGQGFGGPATVTPNTLSSGVQVGAVPREGFLTAAFVWMFIGLLLSAGSAVFVMNNEAALTQVVNNWIILFIAQIGLVMAISFLIGRLPSLVALGLFFAYALLMGLTLGVIVLAYVGTIGMSGVVSAFLGSSAIFAGAAVYGAVTKRDLTSLGGLLFMGLIGLLVVLFLQLFLFPGNGMASFLIGVVGVIIFTGLTAFDVQRIRNGQMAGISRESASVVGALALYLDFVNLFIMMLRIFGSSR
jgi:uncharacterized protein